MTKQELLKLHPEAYAAKSTYEWNIWSNQEMDVWLGSGEDESEAWDAACQESVF